jgi:hypothetical protein
MPMASATAGRVFANRERPRAVGLVRVKAISSHSAHATGNLPGDKSSSMPNKWAAMVFAATSNDKDYQ